MFASAGAEDHGEESIACCSMYGLYERLPVVSLMVGQVLSSALRDESQVLQLGSGIV